MVALFIMQVAYLQPYFIKMKNSDIHLQALTHQSSWMDVPLSTFKRIVSKFMDGVYKNTSGKSINYYAYIETHGKKDMRNTFANKGLLN